MLCYCKAENTANSLVQNATHVQIFSLCLQAASNFIATSFAASVGVRWMIGVTEINRGSTYGNNDNKQKRK